MGHSIKKLKAIKRTYDEWLDKADDWSKSTKK